MKEVPTFEELFQLILQDYRNLLDGDGNPLDTSQGSVTAVDSAVLASGLQGAYYRARFVEGQALPNLDQSTDETVEGWAAFFGVYRLEGEQTADLLQRLIARVQQPPAGGNEGDWVAWSKSVTYDHGTFVEVIAESAPIEHLRAAGSIDLYIVSDWSLFPLWEAKVYDAGEVVRYTASGVERIWEALIETDTSVPVDGAMWELRGGSSSQIVSATQVYIEEERALGVHDNQYHQATITPTDVEIRVDTIQELETALAELIGYLNTLKTSEPLYLSVLTAIMVSYGAKVVEFDTPAGDVIPEGGEKIIAGAVSITIDAGL